MFVIASLGEVTALVAAAAAFLAAAGGLLGIWEYRMKSRAKRVEMDVELSKLLAELIPIANARGVPVVSDAAAQAIAEVHLARGSEMDEVEAALSAAAITPVLGEATQAGAIASVGYLGARHETLRPSARRALKTLSFPADSTLEEARREALAMVESSGT